MFSKDLLLLLMMLTVVNLVESRRLQLTVSDLELDVALLSNKIRDLEWKVQVLWQSGWIVNGASSYLFVTNQMLNWQDAMAHCASIGATLVGIESQTEQDFLANEMKKQAQRKPYWTGGNDINSEGTWMWGGSPRRFTVTYWGANEPNGISAGEDCVEVVPDWAKYKSWNDADCHGTRPFICERRM